MSSKQEVWVHGNDFEAEYLQSVDRFIRRGWGIHYWGKENTSNWFHIPVQAPLISDLSKIFVLFKTTGSVKVKSIHIYNGQSKIFAKDNLTIAGDYLQVTDVNTFKFDNPLKISQGLCICVGVEFGVKSANIDPEILFTTVGAEFA